MIRAKPRPWRAALIVLAPVLTACRTIEGTYGVPPFYEVYPTPSTFGPVEGSETYLRPFVGLERTPAEAVKTSEGAVPPGTSRKREALRVRSIPPFLEFRRGPAEYRNWVLPIYLYQSMVHAHGREDTDWAVFPIFYGGHDPEEGSYFAVFPFWGNLKGLLAQDEIRFYFFPAYWHARDRTRHSLHIVWPFYNEVWGGGWKGSRLWPFHGRYRSYTEDGALRHDRTFTAWPFYIRRKDQLHILPTDFFFTFPFYGEQVNSRTIQRTYLWPLYQYFYDRRYDRELHMGYLFPYRFTEGQTDAWPFFGVKQVDRGTSIGGIRRRTYRQFAIWPIQRYSWGTDGLEESTRLWLLPLFWHFYYIDKDTLETKKHLKVWPLFSYRREGREVAFDLISPLWFQREEYERYYSRWFNIFRYRWKPEISGWEVLYGALMYRREPARGDSLFSILGGLFECGTRDGSPAFRLLYLPWRTD